MRRLVSLLLLAVGLAPASAVVLLNESFNYTNGPLGMVSGSNWQTFSGTSGPIMVTNSRAAMNLANGEDSQVFLDPSPSTDTVFAGFTLRFTPLPPGGGSYFALFKGTGSGTDFRARVFALTNSAAGGKYRLSLPSAASAPNVTNTTDLSTNTDYRVIVRLLNGTGAATLWINPAAETDPSVTTTESPSSSAAAPVSWPLIGNPPATACMGWKLPQTCSRGPCSRAT